MFSVSSYEGDVPLVPGFLLQSSSVLHFQEISTCSKSHLCCALRRKGEKKALKIIKGKLRMTFIRHCYY